MTARMGEPITGRVNGGRLVVEWMAARGITSFFNVPGESFLTVLDALQDTPTIRLVTNRHESGASFAAEAWGKVTGRPAVCMATRGPGASNLTIGVQTAFYDGTPMLAFVGLVPRGMRGSRAFQEFDPNQLFGSISKRVFTVDDLRTAHATLDQALAVSCEGRPGPVVVGLPTDVLSETIERPTFTTPTPLANRFSWDPGSIVEAVRSARRPALLAGTDAMRQRGGRELAEIAGALGLPAFGAWRRYSAFDNEHPNYVGSLGLGAADAVTAALGSADVVLAIGSALDQVTCQSGQLNRDDVTILQISSQVDADLTRHVPAAHVSQFAIDPALAGAELLAYLRANAELAAACRARHAAATAGAVEAARAVGDADPPTGGVDQAVLMRRLDDLLADDAIVTSDAGNFAQWLLRYIRFGQRRAFLGPLNGAMGYGLPSAIGASLAAADRPVCCIAGDGGFVMTGAEMATAVQLGLSLSAVVVDNGVYGTIRAKQDAETPGRLPGTAIGGVDIAAMARAMGWSAVTVEVNDDVGPALEAALRAPRGCHLVHARVAERPLELG